MFPVTGLLFWLCGYNLDFSMVTQEIGNGQWRRKGLWLRLKWLFLGSAIAAFFVLHNSLVGLPLLFPQ